MRKARRSIRNGRSTPHGTFQAGKANLHQADPGSERLRISGDCLAVPVNRRRLSCEGDAPCQLRPEIVEPLIAWTFGKKDQNRDITNIHAQGPDNFSECLPPWQRPSFDSSKFLLGTFGPITRHANHGKQIISDRIKCQVKNQNCLKYFAISRHMREKKSFVCVCFVWQKICGDCTVWSHGVLLSQWIKLKIWAILTQRKKFQRHLCSLCEDVHLLWQMQKFFNAFFTRQDPRCSLQCFYLQAFFTQLKIPNLAFHKHWWKFSRQHTNRPHIMKIISPNVITNFCREVFSRNKNFQSQDENNASGAQHWFL